MQFLVQMGGNILQAVFDDGALCAAFLVSTTRLQKSNGTGQSVCSCSQHGKTPIKHSLFSLTVSQFFHYSQDIDNKCKGWLPLQKRAGL